MKRISGRLALCVVALATTLASAWAAEPPPPPFGPPSGVRSGVEPQVADPTRTPRAEFVYKPIIPCRVFGGQAIATNQTKGFLVSGSSNLTAQGGPAAGCGIPPYAKAVSINISSGTSTAQGYLTAYATGAARPNQASLSFRAYPATTGSIVQLGTGGRISVFASAATRVTGDVAGYFVEQIEGMISPSGAIYSGGSGIVSAEVNSAGVYTVTVDRDVTYCTPVVTAYSGRGVYASAYAFNNNKVVIYTWYISSTTHLEVANSYYVYLAVHC